MDKANGKDALKVKEIKNKLLIGIDIGGSLTKICIITKKEDKEINDFLNSKKDFKCEELDSFKLYFKHFLTNNFEKDIFPVLIEIDKKIKIDKIEATGGGAYKFYDITKTGINIELIKHDELLSLVYGYKFMNKYNSFYEIDNNISKSISPSEFTFPHITVNIGTGVSFLKVSSLDKYERIGGTLLGGGSFIGLAKTMIHLDNYDEIIELATKGNYENIDLTLKDLMKEEDKIENCVISSFGKIPEYIQKDIKNNLRKEDIALSLFNMICYEIAQYGILYAEKYNTNTIYYFGTFTKNFSIINQTINKVSKNLNKNIKVRFNKFEGYLGAIGSLLEKSK